MSLSKYSNSFRSSKIFYKKLLFNILQKRQNKEQGFTLIELLVSMVILTIVVGMTGTGLVFIMSTNTKSDQQITQQANLRRAADFIADEIKSASVVLPTDPTVVTVPPNTVFLPASSLYLEIPVPVESGTTAPTLKVTNHGLSVGDLVRFSGTNLSTAGLTSKNTTHSVISTPDKDTFRVSATITAIPTDLTVRRLVGYSTATPELNWKGPRVLYRATGAGTCNATSANCQVVIDSLTLSDSFVPDVSKAPQINIDLKAQLSTTETSSISMFAISRATLK